MPTIIKACLVKRVGPKLPVNTWICKLPPCRRAQPLPHWQHPLGTVTPVAFGTSDKDGNPGAALLRGRCREEAPYAKQPGGSFQASVVKIPHLSPSI